jgi:hypothetical protein
MVVNLQMAIDLYRWTIINHVFIWSSIASWYACFDAAWLPDGLHPRPELSRAFAFTANSIGYRAVSAHNVDAVVG